MEPSDTHPLTHESLVADLRTLRRHGLIRMRAMSLAALDKAAAQCGLVERAGRASEGEQQPAAVEQLVRDAVAGLGGELTAAAQYTFGLATGTRGWSIGQRRRRAAETCGVSVERFRKHQESIVIEQVAEEILKMCAARGRSATPTAPSPEAPRRGRTTVSLPLRVGGATRTLTLHVMPIELISGIDVVVSSENVGLEMSKFFQPTVSAALRRAGATRNVAGEIVDDVIQHELTEWLRRHGHLGGLVPAGTVVPTTAGALSAEGVRRIYHAAVAVPRPDTTDYSVAADAVAIAIRNVFRLIGKENEECDPPLASICFPLFGAGRGGVEPEISFSWIWAALDQQLRADDQWWLHLVTHSAQQAEAVIRAVTAGPDGPGGSDGRDGLSGRASGHGSMPEPLR
jgi:O-acetyl-ADP-ribose deacetylase (regulator of RNase III)